MNVRSLIPLGGALFLAFSLLGCPNDPIEIPEETEKEDSGTKQDADTSVEDEDPGIDVGPDVPDEPDVPVTPTWQPLHLEPVAEWREADYQPRARPQSLELSTDERELYVALAGNWIDPLNQVLVLDATTGDHLDTIEVGRSPVGMALGPDGSKLYVANQMSNYISVINLETRTESGQIPVDFYAQDLAFSANGAELYVTNRYLDAVQVVSLDSSGFTGEVTKTIKVGTNPRDVAVQDGKLFVGNVAGTSVSVVDPAAGVELQRLHLNAPGNGVAAGNGYVFVATQGRGDGHPKTPSQTNGVAFRGDGTANQGFADIDNDVAVFGASSGQMLWRYTSDTAEVSHHDEEGDYAEAEMIVEGALPEQAFYSNNRLYVTMSASDELQVFDVSPGSGSLQPAGNYDTGINPFEVVVNQSGFLAYTANRLGGTISRINLQNGSVTEFDVEDQINPRVYPANEYETGELLFHSAKFSSEALPSEIFPQGTKAGDKSCQHCHREFMTDGKVWSVGIGLLVYEGGERMPPAARNIRDTSPLFWEGVQEKEDFDLETDEFAPLDDFEQATEALNRAARDEFFVEQVGYTFDQIGRQIIGEFLVGRPRLLPNPLAQYPTAEQMPRLERGRQLFHSPEVACSTCHPSADSSFPFTNNENLPPVIPTSGLDTGLQFKHEVDGHFNVPSIRGVWDRPTIYFHDGRGKSLKAAILATGHPALTEGEDGCHMLGEETDEFWLNLFRPVYNGQGCNVLQNGGMLQHGGTSGLTEAEVDDLLWYVRSIE